MCGPDSYSYAAAGTCSVCPSSSAAGDTAEEHAGAAVCLKERSWSTLAGSLAAVVGFEDGIGNSASFNHLTGVDFARVEEGGMLFVADQWNHAIRTVETDRVRTLAGGHGGGQYGTYGFVDGIGTQASFYNPKSVAFHSASDTVSVPSCGVIAAASSPRREATHRAALTHEPLPAPGLCRG